MVSHPLLRATCARRNPSRPAGQGVLEGRTLCLEHFAELLRECSCRQTPQRTPVAMPLTPPSGFVRAVILAPIRVSALETLACDKLSQADRSNSNVSVSSNIPFKCSYVHPSGPGEDPRGALLRLARNVFLSEWTGTSGSKLGTS